MPYLIQDIKIATPESGYKYLFDANVWLAVLDHTYSNKSYTPYINFFNKIITNSVVKDASIVVPALLLSELLNRLINDIYYKEYIVSNTPLPTENKHSHFKKYRCSDQYKIDIELACSSIRDYHRKIIFVSDNLEQYSCKDLIKNIPTHLDINDYLYSKIALEQGLIIVTNDSDFIIEDVHILTAHPVLLKLTQ